MHGIYVHQSKGIPYADAIVGGYKKIETRTKNTLGRFVGQRVFIVRTMDGRKPVVVGSVRIASACYRTPDWLEEHRNETCVPPGSRFDHHGRGKWIYRLDEPDRYETPLELKDFNVTKRTRTFVEIKV